MTRIFQGQGVILLDGGLGTYLSELGYDLNDEIWSAKVLVEDPDRIRQIHRDYYVNGADVAITCSYQVSFEKFRARGFTDDQIKDFLKRSIQLAHEARVECSQSKRLYVAASVGPFGAAQGDGSEYDGRYHDSLSIQQLMDWHQRRLDILAQDPMKDLVAVETIPCLNEVSALCQLMQAYPSVPFYLSITCRDSTHLSSGESIASFLDLVQELDPLNLIAIGVNCTPPEHVESIVHTFKATKWMVVAYPNTGEEWDPQSKTWKCTPTALKDFVDWCRRYKAAGVDIIGGCCRTTPEYITALDSSLR